MALRQAIKAGNAYVLLEIRDNTARFLRNFARNVDALGKRLAITGIGLTIAGTTLTRPFVTAVREFSKFQQLSGRFNQVFGKLSAAAEQFGTSFARSINESRSNVLDQLATFQSFFLGLGANSEQAFELSRRLTKLTNDFVAFDDSLTGPNEALERLLSVLTGETEAAKRLRIGLDIREARLAKELADQFGVTARAATQLQKTLAIINLTFESAGLAGVTGQAVREVDTLAARIRGATGAVKEFFIEVGAALEQDSIAILKDFTEIVQGFQRFVKANKEGIAQIARVTAQITGFGVALTALAFAMPPVAAASQLLAAAISVAFANPLTIAVSAITAFTAALVNWESVIDRVSSTFEGFGGRILRLVKAGDIENAGRFIVLTFEAAILEGLARLDKEVRQAAIEIFEGVKDSLIGKDIGKGSFVGFTAIEQITKERKAALLEFAGLQQELERATAKAEFGRKFFATRDADTVRADIEAIVVKIGEMNTELARLKGEAFGATALGVALKQVREELNAIRDIADRVRDRNIVSLFSSIANFNARGPAISALIRANDAFGKGLRATANALGPTIGKGLLGAARAFGKAISREVDDTFKKPVEDFNKSVFFAFDNERRTAAAVSKLLSPTGSAISSIAGLLELGLIQIEEEGKKVQETVDSFFPAIRSTIGGALAPLLFGPFGPGNVQRDILNENKKQNEKLDAINRNLQQNQGFRFAAG